MLVTGIFRSNNPLNASILFIYGLLLKLPYFMKKPVPEYQPSDGFLFNEFMDLVHPFLSGWPFVTAAITYLLLFTQALTVNYYINSEKMVAKPNFMVAMSYLLLTSLFPEWNILSATLIVNTILLWVIGKMLKLANTPKPKATIFNLGFAIGICSFLYLPSLFLLLVILIGLTLARPARAGEWALVFLGFITPWYFLTAWLFLTGKIYAFYAGHLEPDLPEVVFSNLLYFKIGAIFLLFLMGSYFIQSETKKQIIQVRNRWSMILASVIIVFFIPFMNENNGFADWIITILFLAPLAGITFLYMGSKWLRMLLHWSIVALVLFTQYL